MNTNVFLCSKMARCSQFVTKLLPIYARSAQRSILTGEISCVGHVKRDGHIMST